MVLCIDGQKAQHAAPGAVRKWFVYILACCDGTLYTGCTTDLDRRLQEHNESPRGAKYTRSRRPVKLVFWAPHPDRSAAQREEARIKKLSRAQKLQLIKEMS